MEKEKLDIVLADILDELKISNKAIQEQKQQILELHGKLPAFEEKTNRLNESAKPAIDINAVVTAIKTAVTEIKQLTQQQSRPIMREWRFLLFPADYSKEYYVVIFRLIMWMALVCIGPFLFSLSKQALENSKEIKLRQFRSFFDFII